MNLVSDMQTTSTSTRESETSSSEGGSFIIDSTAFYENLNFHRMRSNVMVSKAYLVHIQGKDYLCTWTEHFFQTHILKLQFRRTQKATLCKIIKALIAPLSSNSQNRVFYPFIKTSLHRAARFPDLNFKIHGTRK